MFCNRAGSRLHDRKEKKFRCRKKIRKRHSSSKILSWHCNDTVLMSWHCDDTADAVVILSWHYRDTVHTMIRDSWSWRCCWRERRIFLTEKKLEEIRRIPELLVALAVTRNFFPENPWRIFGISENGLFSEYGRKTSRRCPVERLRVLTTSTARCDLREERSERDC